MKALERVNSDSLFRNYISKENNIKFVNNFMKDEEIKESRNQSIFENQIQTTKNMLKDKVNIYFISKYTKLSVNQINSITI